ncbi:MAG: hypothetical protein F4X84_08190, partial [Synechococcus sp. SB0662_bin_45]|nr:hypothetical protein [Synechococcus sp. SB0662_bin_45]
MHIAVIGLSHHTAPVEVRERLSITDETLPSSLRSLMAVQEVQEASILSTCNRLEIYTLLRQADAGIAAMVRFLSDRSGLPATELKPHLFDLHHAEAIDHLLRVAAGLDSLVLGEGQILAQVKKMARLGQEHKSTGPILGRLLNQAVSTGKRVRSETRLGTGAVSISSAAVELAQLKCLVLGEGQILAQVKKMARLGQEHKSTGPILGRLLNQAVSTGKRVRSETRLGTGAVSISSAAVELAQLKCAQERGTQHPVGLGEEAVAVVGCGRMGRLLVQHLA